MDTIDYPQLSLVSTTAWDTSQEVVAVTDVSTGGGAKIFLALENKPQWGRIQTEERHSSSTQLESDVEAVSDHQQDGQQQVQNIPQKMNFLLNL